MLMVRMGKDGLDIVWKGELSTSPANPQKNWVYRNTIDGRVYIYNGISWTLMVADGNDGTEGTNGKDGKDVYITYHDSEEEPARPTGNGTTRGMAYQCNGYCYLDFSKGSREMRKLENGEIL